MHANCEHAHCGFDVLMPKLFLRWVAIEGVLLASFARQLEKWFPLQSERAQSSYFRCFQKQKREEGETE